MLDSRHRSLRIYVDGLSFEMDVAQRGRNHDRKRECEKRDEDFAALNSAINAAAELTAHHADAGRRLEDVLEALLVARYARDSGIIRPHMTISAWSTLGCLALSIFGGILMIDSGSQRLDMFMCFASLATVAVSFLSIANANEVCQDTASCLAHLREKSPELRPPKASVALRLGWLMKLRRSSSNILKVQPHAESHSRPTQIVRAQRGGK